MSLLDSTFYSTSVGQPAAGEVNSVKYANFVAHIEVDLPNSLTKRFEAVRHMEKIGHRLENNLKDHVRLNINSGPLALNLNFAQKVCKITVVGDYRKYENPMTTSNVSIIHSGTDIGESTAAISGNLGGSLSQGQNTITAFDDEVAEFLNDFGNIIGLNSTGLTISNLYYLNYGGVKYGRGGRTFPS